MSDGFPIRCPECNSWWALASFVWGILVGAGGMFVLFLWNVK